MGMSPPAARPQLLLDDGDHVAQEGRAGGDAAHLERVGTEGERHAARASVIALRVLIGSDLDQKGADFGQS